MLAYAYENPGPLSIEIYVGLSKSYCYIIGTLLTLRSVS
jgi:hypothetical protein